MGLRWVLLLLFALGTVVPSVGTLACSCSTHQRVAVVAQPEIHRCCNSETNSHHRQQRNPSCSLQSVCGCQQQHSVALPAPRPELELGVMAQEDLPTLAAPVLSMPDPSVQVVKARAPPPDPVRPSRALWLAYQSLLI